MMWPNLQCDHRMQARTQHRSRILAVEQEQEQKSCPHRNPALTTKICPCPHRNPDNNIHSFSKALPLRQNSVRIENLLIVSASELCPCHKILSSSKPCPRCKTCPHQHPVPPAKSCLHQHLAPATKLLPHKGGGLNFCEN